MKLVVRIVAALLLLFVVLPVLVLWLYGMRPGAGRITGVTEIARPPAEVFPWLTEPAKLKQWASWLVDVRRDTARAEGVGSKSVWVLDDPHMKQRIEIHVTTTAWDPPRGYAARIEMAGAFHGDIQYALADLGGRTRLTVDTRAHYDDAFARLMEPLITPESKRKSAADSAHLRALIEAAPHRLTD